MKIFIDGYGVIGHSLTRKLVDVHAIDPSDLFVNTYKSDPVNASYLEYLNKIGARVEFSDYKNQNFVQAILNFRPTFNFSFYGRRILPGKVLDAAEKTSLNLHPSLLPDYKGCFSNPWVIINGEKITGITIHKMVEDVDAGDILYQEIINIDKFETSFSLHNKQVSAFINIFDDFFKKLIANELKPRKMLGGGRYYPREIPFHGVINPEWPATKIEAFIRAMHFPPFPGAFFQLDYGVMECDTFERYINLRGGK